MHPLLAQIYANSGVEKTASDNGIPMNDFGNIDLSRVSAADYLKALAELEGGDDEQILEKMASSGELSHWDMAGRTMAHAYADELEKIASSNEDEELYDLEEISAQDLSDALESGEFELVQREVYDVDTEKVAGVKDFLKRGKDFAGAGFSRAKDAVMSGAGRANAAVLRKVHGPSDASRATELAAKQDRFASLSRSKKAALISAGLLGTGAVGAGGHLGVKRYLNRDQ